MCAFLFTALMAFATVAVARDATHAWTGTFQPMGTANYPGQRNTFTVANGNLYVGGYETVTAFRVSDGSGR